MHVANSLAHSDRMSKKSKYELHLHYLYGQLKLVARTFDSAISIVQLDAQCRFPLPGSLRFYFREKNSCNPRTRADVAKKELAAAIPKAVFDV